MKLYYLAVAEGDRGRENLLYLHRFAQKTGVLDMVRLAPQYLFIGSSVPRVPGGGAADHVPPAPVAEILPRVRPLSTALPGEELRIIDDALIEKITAPLTQATQGIRATAQQMRDFLTEHIGQYILGIEIG